MVVLFRPPEVTYFNTVYGGGLKLLFPTWYHNFRELQYKVSNKKFFGKFAIINYFRLVFILAILVYMQKLYINMADTHNILLIRAQNIYSPIT